MKVGRNALCPCGSAKKYKECCLSVKGEGETTPIVPGTYFDLKGKKAEQLVHDLALKTFLTDWCYLNPQLPNGKELCDLLVVFDDVAVIWQIKDLKLDEDGSYKRLEVEKNLKQLSGARRQLFDLKTKIVLGNPRRGKEPFDAESIKDIYLISVLMGEGEDHFSLVETIRDYTVHVFTRDSTQIILRELDTITDFCKYLREKEKLVSQDKEITIIGGEEELLAEYLMNNHSFAGLSKYSRVIMSEGKWKSLQESAQFKAKKKLDKISYGWDNIIDRAHEGSAQYELVARELARPNRFERRSLSKTFYDAHVKAHEDREKDLLRRIVVAEGVTYCFLFADDPEPRERRRAMLEKMCYVARGIHTQNRKVIGIATGKKIRPTCSYDYCVMYLPDWTEEHQRMMKEIQAKTGIFTNVQFGEFNEDEYPTAYQVALKLVPSIELKQWKQV